MEALETLCNMTIVAEPKIKHLYKVQLSRINPKLDHYPISPLVAIITIHYERDW